MNQYQERVLNYMKDSKKSQGAVAKEIGISETALSQYMNDKYPGDVEAVEKKIDEFLNFAKKAAEVTNKQGFVPTSTSKEVYNLIAYCHKAHYMGILIGQAGIGKTQGAYKYASDHSEAIYITATKACKSLRTIYKMIARKLRINENQNIADLEMDIKRRLDGSSKIIVIDEAQHLPVTAVDGLRCLNDEDLESGLQPVGIVLIGNFDLWAKMNGKYEAQYDQVRNRFRIKRFFATKDVKMEDIQKLFPAYEPEKSEKELDFLYGIARSRWAVRGAMTIYMNATNNGDNSFKGLDAIAKYLCIDSRN